MTNTPLKVHVYRGDIIESCHAVHCIVMDKSGDILESWGDENRLVFPRSSLKPLQAIPLIESGALDSFGLGSKEIALACASHNAEPIHLKTVTAWLKKVDLRLCDLECGPHLSINKDRAHEMILNKEELTALYSGCSGKHAGMLTTAQHQDQVIKGYIAFDHPVQQQIFQTISEMADYDLLKGYYGIDGCSAPNPAIPLKNITLAFARLANSMTLSSERMKSCSRVLDAMAKHPYLIGGKDRFDSILVEASKGNIISKLGAEGNYISIVRDKGLIIYLKTEDGALERASYPVLGALLNKFSVIDNVIDKAIDIYTRPVLRNWNGLDVGKITVPSLDPYLN